MHFEFLPLIELAFKRAMPEIAARFADELSAAAAERMQSLGEIEVCDCPDYIRAALTTNLPFAICSMLDPLGAKERGVTPLFVGELLITHAPEAIPHFNLSIGGPGFLNAEPTDPFIGFFFERAFTEHSNYLFSRSSFVLSRIDEVPLEPFRANLRQLKELQQKRIKNEDLEILEAHVRDKGGAADADDLLMYLALLADPEIDSGPFLHKLGSSENVPWFFRRFFFDARRAVRSKHAVSAIGAAEFSTFRLSATGRLSAPLIGKLLHLRYVYQNARKRRRPELHLAAVLSIVRTWYSVFNRPECRRLLMAPAGSAEQREAQGFSALTRLIASVVDTSRQNLEFCCDSTHFVLNIGPAGS